MADVLPKPWNARTRVHEHRFRRAENIRAALDGELSFYAQVWGFGLPGEEGTEPIDIERS